jgi:hypothetical protein
MDSQILEMAFLLETDELKHENNAGLFRASEQAHSFFKLQEDDREKKKKAQEISDELKKHMDSLEDEMGFHPPGASEVIKSKKMQHSTGLLRSQPKDAGTILIDSIDSNNNNNGNTTTKKQREHHRPGDFDGIGKSTEGLDNAVKQLSNLVTEAFAQKPKMTFSDALTERMNVKRKLQDLGNDDDDVEFKDMLKQRIQFLDEQMKRTVRDDGMENKNN